MNQQNCGRLSLPIPEGCQLRSRWSERTSARHHRLGLLPGNPTPAGVAETMMHCSAENQNNIAKSHFRLYANHSPPYEIDA